MDIKSAGQSRVETYGIALGLVLYAAWRGLVRIFAPRIYELRRQRAWRWSL